MIAKPVLPVRREAGVLRAAFSQPCLRMFLGLAYRRQASTTGSHAAHTRTTALIAILLLAIAGATPAAAAERAVSIPMAAGAWTLPAEAGWIPRGQGGKTGFARYEGMASGTMTIHDEAIIAARDAHFTNGTIEFDIKALEYNDTGIVFRRNGNDSGEFLYLRANPDCPAANDCIQYVPVTHGIMSWNLYSAEQGPAPITAAGWNHIRLVVAGERMAVFVNHLPEPTLVVKLRSAGTGDGIAFKGPATYANLTLKPGSAEALASLQDAAPPSGTITTWRAAPPLAFPPGHAPAPTDIPPDDAWQTIDAAPDGLVDLGRAFGPAHAPAISTGWLQFAVNADKPARRTLTIGWTGEVSVFLNGKSVYLSSNDYYPAEGRRSPDGRLAPDNAAIPLDLRAGDNRVVLAVSNRWQSSAGTVYASPYGWGAQARVLSDAREK